ncbi:transposase [Candidatus Cloacimonadaceae bacterium]
MPDHNYISQENQKYEFKSRNLPHKYDTDKPVFITYSLKFSLPEAVMAEYSQRKENWEKQLLELSKDDRAEKLKSKDGLIFAWFDEPLDKTPDIPRILHQPEICDIIKESFQHFDGLRYKLLAYSVMPNHVHVVIFPLRQEDGEAYSFHHIIYSWKRFTANAINKLLNRKGSLWQKEGYNRLIKDEMELGRVVNYVLNNPVRAGLVKEWQDWRGNYLLPSLFG